MPWVSPRFRKKLLKKSTLAREGYSLAPFYLKAFFSIACVFGVFWALIAGLMYSDELMEQRAARHAPETLGQSASKSVPALSKVVEIPSTLKAEPQVPMPVQALPSKALAERQPLQGVFPFALTSNVKNAEVWINGQALGTAPIALSLDAGHYSIKVKSPDHLVYWHEITLKDALTLAVTLTPNGGQKAAPSPQPEDPVYSRSDHWLIFSTAAMPSVERALSEAGFVVADVPPYQGFEVLPKLAALETSWQAFETLPQDSSPAPSIERQRARDKQPVAEQPVRKARTASSETSDTDLARDRDSAHKAQPIHRAVKKDQRLCGEVLIKQSLGLESLTKKELKIIAEHC